MMKTSLLRFGWLLPALVLGAACASGDTTSGGVDPGTTGGDAGAAGSTAGTSGSSTGGSGGSSGTSGASGSSGSSGSAGTGGTAGTAGNAGTGGTSGSAGSAGTGGTAGAPQCSAPSDCPGTDSACAFRTCEAGVCGMGFTASGTATNTQINGDCLVSQCDGAGNVVTVVDDTDVPDDTNPCTTDSCNAGQITHTNEVVGASCGTNLKCDGNGACVGCVTKDDCPGTDDECKTRTCTSGACGFSFTTAGTAVSTQTPGDCLKNQCDGAGNIATVADGNDLPIDNNECTSDSCNAGTPSHGLIAAGAPCTQNGTVCDGSGSCVQCVNASTCPAAPNECQTAVCTNGTCGFDNVAVGTLTAGQTSGDCKKVQCDGNGNIQTVNDDTDVNNDNNACTVDTCNAGAPVHTPASAGVSCGTNQVCNASGSCVGCNVATDCAGTDTTCKFRTCINNVCGTGLAPAGTPLPNQNAGDCQKLQCNAAGNVISIPDNTDLPADDGFQCTAEVCNSGVPSHPAKSAGSACSEGSGSLCNGTGSCVQCLIAATCPGSDTECQTRTCDSSGTCGVSFAAPGTPLAAQTAGDCQQLQCSGSGTIVSVAQNTDTPADDNNPCTTQACAAGMPVYPAVSNGTACTDSNACTTGDSCQNGTCTASSSVTCTASDSCHTAGSCDSSTGICSNPAKADGSTCTSAGKTGACTSGVCIACGDGITAGSEQCDDGNSVNGDGCDNNCKTSGCGNGVVAGSEQCDDGNSVNGDGCDNNCKNTGCGNGIVTTGEACDDGNTTNGDGCTSACAVQSGYQCTGTSPSVCSPIPTCAGSTCPAYLPACGAGQTLRTYSNTTATAIPDANTTGITTSVTVPAGYTINKVAVVFNITHTWDSDLAITLISPANTSFDATSGNGSSGDNYTNTVLDSTCSTAVTSGSAPFTGCYTPEATFSSLVGSSATGTWKLKVVDSVSSDTGTLTNWTLALCTTP
ncbi:MAG: proprotein convertase P-domain-containing protein [Polyangiaceae bacterium]